MNKLFFFIALLSSISLVAQSNKDQAEDLYEDFGYKTSIPFFEDLLARSGDKDVQALQKIATSYRKVHDTENAEKWYGELVKVSDEPLNFLYYAQALQSNGKLEKAKEFYLKYDQNFGGSDNRGSLLAAAIDRMATMDHENINLTNVVQINSPKLEFSPTYYKNGIVFVSSQPVPGSKNNRKDIWIADNFMSLFYAQRDNDGYFSKPQSFSGKLNTGYHEGPVAFSKDGERIFFTRNSINNGKKKKSDKGRLLQNIFTATKNGNDWTEVTELPFNTDNYEEVHPTLSADEKVLIFASDRPGGFGGMDLYRSELKNDVWTPPTNLGAAINTAGNELFPFLHDDGTLFFASNGLGGLGGLDIFYTQIGKNYKIAPINIGAPINSPKDDFGLILNVLKSEGYFSSARKNGRGKDDIYSLSLDPSIFKEQSLITLNTTVCVYDDRNNNRIPNAQISVLKKLEDGNLSLVANNELITIKVETDGSFSILAATPITGEERYENKVYQTDANGEINCVLLPEESYVFLVEKDNYGTSQKVFSTEGLSNSNDLSFCVPIENKPSDCITFKGVVRQKETNELLPNATITLINNCTGAKIFSSSNLLGEFVLPCQPVNCGYSMEAVKDGFDTGILSINQNDFIPGDSEKIFLVTLSSSGISAVGSGLKDDYASAGNSIVLEDIYYDFNDYHLRGEATHTLDKLAGLMRQYPSLKIELSSHTDSRGDNRSNKRLSVKRAKYAVRYLKGKGINENRLTWNGYGEQLLRNDCGDGAKCSEEEHQFNRRTEIKITNLDANDRNLNFSGSY